MVYVDSLGSLLNDSSRARARIVKANALREKIQFVQDVVEQWIDNGGMGRLHGDADMKDLGITRALAWHGLAVKESGKGALNNVTVGRYGGDLPSSG